VTPPDDGREVGRAAVSRRQWLALLSAAAAARAGVAFGVLGDMGLQSDALQYSEVARQVLAEFPGTTAYFWPPGMLYYLAAVYGLFGSDLAVSRLAMVGLGLATTAMVVVVSREAFRDGRVAVTAGWIAALYPPAVLMSGQTYTQELASLALLSFAWSVFRFLARPRARWGVVAGLALGVGILTRPSMLSVLALATVAAVGWAVVRGGSGARAVAAALVLIYACVLSAVLPAMAHNAAHGEGWSLSINNEMNFFMGNNPHTHYYKTSHLAQRGFDQIDPETAAYIGGYLELENRRAAMRDAAVRYVLEHPFTTAWRTFSRVRAFWGFDYIMSRAIQNHRGGSMPTLLVFLCFEAGGYLLLMLAIVSGAIIAFRSGLAVPCLLLIGLALSYQAPYALAFSSGTYHFPVMGLLMPIAALNAMRSWRGSPVRRAEERVVFWCAAVLLVVVQVEYGYHAAQLSGLQ